MNMIQKTYNCVSPDAGSAPEFQVSAWQAMGSSTVNLRLRDESGWFEWIETHNLNDPVYLWRAAVDGKTMTMDDLVDYLYEVVPA
jgi:hypothetical protein